MRAHKLWGKKKIEKKETQYKGRGGNGGTKRGAIIRKQ